MSDVHTEDDGDQGPQHTGSRHSTTYWVVGGAVLLILLMAFQANC